jgi:hypothetical protein
MKSTEANIFDCEFCGLSTDRKSAFNYHKKACGKASSNIDSILSEYKNGTSLRNIISNYNLPRELIIRIFKKNSVTIRSNKEAPKNKVGKKHTVESKMKLSANKKEYYKNNPDNHPWRSSSKFISKPCENFKKIIEEMKIPYVPEMRISEERFFSIDIAFPQYRIGIEINGNQHYDSDGSLKKYYKDRHDYITNLGWQLHQIHYSLCFNETVIKNILDQVVNSTCEVIHDFDYNKYLLEKLNKNKPKLCVCGNKIIRTSKKCRVCAKKETSFNSRKVERPTYESLKAEVDIAGYEATGRKYGVSGNAVKKWIKYYQKEKSNN